MCSGRTCACARNAGTSSRSMGSSASARPRRGRTDDAGNAAISEPDIVTAHPQRSSLPSVSGGRETPGHQRPRHGTCVPRSETVIVAVRRHSRGDAMARKCSDAGSPSTAHIRLRTPSLPPKLPPIRHHLPRPRSAASSKASRPFPLARIYRACNELSVRWREMLSSARPLPASVSWSGYPDTGGCTLPTRR